MRRPKEKGEKDKPWSTTYYRKNYRNIVYNIQNITEKTIGT